MIKEKCSSLHTAWLLKEVISCHLEKGNSVYVGLLDIKKAYDTIWQDGMFYKLYKYGINGKTWRLIRNFYKNFKCQIHFGSLSELFEALQGIHQGAPCSTLLFVLFENELLQLLKRLQESIKMCNVNVACPAFADDVSLVATSKDHMQSMFNIAYSYSCKWRFEFSPQKCKIVIFGKDRQADVHIRLGNHDVTESASETHLGVGLVTNKKCEAEFVQNRISSTRSILLATKAIGSKSVPMLPVTASKLYWEVCIPKLTYGFEVMATSLQKVETFHYQASKIVQGLPQQAVNIGSLATLGWQPID